MIGKAIAMLAIVIAAAAANGSPSPIPGLPQSTLAHLARPPAPMVERPTIEYGMTPYITPGPRPSGFAVMSGHWLSPDDPNHGRTPFCVDKSHHLIIMVIEGMATDAYCVQDFKPAKWK